jgi:hypothetical protein
MTEQKYYKMKHVPTGLYYQPHVHRGSHLSKKGKIYQTNTNGVESGNYGHKTFAVWCQKDSQIHKITKDILVWVQSSSYNQVKAETEFKDWIREYI